MWERYLHHDTIVKNIQERYGRTLFGRISNIRNRGQASPDLDSGKRRRSL